MFQTSNTQEKHFPKCVSQDTDLQNAPGLKDCCDPIQLEKDTYYISLLKIHKANADTKGF